MMMQKVNIDISALTNLESALECAPPPSKHLAGGPFVENCVKKLKKNPSVYLCVAKVGVNVGFPTGQLTRGGGC